MSTELPYLKNKNKRQGGGEPMEREPDETSPDKLLGMVWDELQDTYHSGDRKGFHQALIAFTHMIKDEAA